jgi:hypothetical protein
MDLVFSSFCFLDSHNNASHLTQYSYSFRLVASNLLFVESPAGVGWSYSNTSSDYTCGDASTGKENSSSSHHSLYTS